LFLILGYILKSLIFVSIGCLAFVTYRVTPFNVIGNTTIYLLSGKFIPITLYPNWLLNIVNILPFKYLFYFPINLLIGQTTSYEIFIALTIMIIWIIVLSIIFKFVYKATIKRVVIQGG